MKRRRKPGRPARVVAPHPSHYSGDDPCSDESMHRMLDRLEPARAAIEAELEEKEADRGARSQAT